MKAIFKIVCNFWTVFIHNNNKKKNVRNIWTFFQRSNVQQKICILFFTSIIPLRIHLMFEDTGKGWFPFYQKLEKELSNHIRKSPVLNSG